jgi:hypothetical protein
VLPPRGRGALRRFVEVFMVWLNLAVVSAFDQCLQGRRASA